MTSAAHLVAIADALDLSTDETLVEIGPGTGALTKVLLERGHSVLAIEKDRDMVAHLKQHFGDELLQIIPKDVLGVSIGRDLHLRFPVKVAGNIPYNITSPILEWLIRQRSIVTLAVLTVQWEVARRLAASPGNKDWGSLSIFLQLYADVSVLRKVSRGCFNPRPKVDSAVIKIAFLSKPRFEISDEALFFRLVRKAFQKRRKTLLNALEDEEVERMRKARLTPLLAGLRIDAKRRPETLSIQEWARLSEALGTPAEK